MGGCRCSYKNCANSTKNTENITFFHYPVKQKQRCKIWIENACKPEFFNLEEEQLRNKVICQNHFMDKWFPNPQKKRLLQGAVPTLDVNSINEQVYIPETTEYVDETIESENEILQRSYRNDNINLVPVSDDNSVFILDTNPLLDHRNKVESYTYRNGDLVKSQTVVRQTYRRQPGLLSTAPLTGSSMKRQAEPITLNQVVSPASGVFGHLPMDQTAMSQQECVLIKQESCETENQDQEEHLEYQQMEEYQEDEMKPIIRQSQKQAGLKSLPVPSVESPSPPSKRQRDSEKDYLRQLKQHSKDIAEIKRMLKQQEPNKMDVTTAVNFLRERLPPTFFTVLCLNMDCKSELADDDIEFFTTLHKTSPEMYQILMEKYKWNLPSVNIVEAD
ncbi:unnamed protein product [Acanthoscelides obtectus]|uniref:THAP-type domain-containing protein n=1 Tax=Acanthoscelides obtectus TaxID=200917 RepID=A0A9P0L6L0_ACAOB|nr:unnamed protein product [Acanthoscelides obtectus]CAK1675174.1 hypothetical protein AOBTE_LOCUS29996 [Acanthoscelides obtectus]